MDGSCRDGGHIGCGGIIKGSDGEWLGGFSKYILIGSAYSTKVLEGLVYAITLQFWFIEFHVDSMVLVIDITLHGHYSWRGRSIAEKIHCILVLDREVVHHFYREANQCTYNLANFGCSMDSGICFFDVSPVVLFICCFLVLERESHFQSSKCPWMMLLKYLWKDESIIMITWTSHSLILLYKWFKVRNLISFIQWKTFGYQI